MSLSKKSKNTSLDNKLSLKWAQPRILYSETNPPPKPGVDCSVEPTKTDQSQAQSCDVNFILKKYQQTGILPGTNVESVYRDVSDVPTYQEALNTVINAQQQFEALDAHTRKKFSNDPSEFLEFASNSENAPELIKMGLAHIIPKSESQQLLDAITGLKTPLVAEPEPAKSK
jgi:phage internal scaffolding protein